MTAVNLCSLRGNPAAVSWLWCICSSADCVEFPGAQEEFYLEENVEKAIAIDEWSPDALTTSMVDDVFFILQKCGGRALAIGSLQCLCAILGQLNNLLRDSLRSALEYKWKVDCQPITIHRTLQH